jgi:hypothetical protein
MCDWFSLQLYIRHSTVGSYGEESDFKVRDQLLKMLPFETEIKPEDIHKTVKACATGIGVALRMLSAVTTDRAPTMIGSNKTLCTKDESFPNFVYYHCIVHQETVCVNILPFGHLMDVIILVINCSFGAFQTPTFI